ncbi:MAG: DUF1566 domain-containing protein, partial [Ilumatobacteraceae bacterium]|nr:DUF1566 domain-containing protein [Ilumatobacteraceae bacterium]
STTETTLAPKTTTTTTTTTTIPKTYQVRDIGPGGGIVFYVATTPFTCGEDLNATPATECSYLEAAITNGIATPTWTPTALTQWGCGTEVMTGDQQTASLEIGRGRANTKMITENTCSSPAIAASIAAAYNGGGKTDWFLPSRKELDALCHEFFKGGPGTSPRGTYKSVDNCKGSGNGDPVSGTTNGISWSFAVGIYWSSSESSLLSAWEQNFAYGYQTPYLKDHKIFVHPVRAF